MLIKRDITKRHLEYLDILNKTRKNINTTTHIIAEKFKVTTPDAQFILESWQEKRAKKKPAGKKRKTKKRRKL